MWHRSLFVGWCWLVVGVVGCGGVEGGAAPSACPCADSALKERCQDMATRLSLACDGDAERTRQIEGYGKLCGRERADVLVKGMACLLDQSQGSCRTFSSPGGADACLSGIQSDFEVWRALDAGRRMAALCHGGESAAEALVVHSDPPLAALSEATLESLSSCLDQASTCATGARCLRAVTGALPITCSAEGAGAGESKESKSSSSWGSEGEKAGATEAEGARTAEPVGEQL